MELWTYKIERAYLIGKASGIAMFEVIDCIFKYKTLHQTIIKNHGHRIEQ